jgi:hypothetical protein
LVFCFDAFSAREPAAAARENALIAELLAQDALFQAVAGVE